MALLTPILFIVFNRPEATAEALEAIRKVQPAKLYIAADGPRPGREDDKLNCAKVKEIVSNINWPCQVKTLYRETNLGCMLGVSGGIDWFFENEEAGIIVEDDCVGSTAFFQFCQQLLVTYQYDERVQAICGRNPLGKYDIEESYLFSRFFKEWGWASWRNRWQKRDLGKAAFDNAERENLFARTLANAPMASYVADTNRSVHYTGHNTWDYQWVFNILSQNGLVAVPAVNLVNNVGLETGVHFGTNPNIQRNLYEVDTHSLAFPLKHPSFVFADNVFDNMCFAKLHPYYLPKQYSLAQRLKDSLVYRIKRLFGVAK